MKYEFKVEIQPIDVIKNTSDILENLLIAIGDFMPHIIESKERFIESLITNGLLPLPHQLLQVRHLQFCYSLGSCHEDTFIRRYNGY